MASSNSIKNLLTTYLRRLTNLSGNNRALFLPKLPAEQFIDLHSLSQLNKEKSFSIIEALIAEKKKNICPVIDSRFVNGNEVSKKLKRLARLDQFIFEERGSKDLHIGWPFVKGKFLDGTCVRCPMLFIPVELVAENNSWYIKPTVEGNIIFNKSFLLAYSFFNKTIVSEALMEEAFESVDRDSTVFRTELYKMLQQAQLEINFNPDNFRDELVGFETYTKTSFEEGFNTGELKLFPEAVLGIFPQASSYLIPDYQTLLDDNSISDLEGFFAKRTKNNELLGLSNYINLIKEEKVYPAYAMDIWQENALKAVKFGNSIVVEGPPGTGKSHLICNLVADAIANKQRVLVVCQKRVALDVVYNRLNEKGLASFLALVHDFKEDRKGLYAKVLKQIESIEDYKQKNNSIDSIQLERKFYSISRRIDQLTEELEEFRAALFNTTDSGLSAHQLYLQTSFLKPYVNFKQEFSHFRLDELDGFLTILKTYCYYAQKFSDEYYLWKDRKSFGSFSQQDFETIKIYLGEIPEIISSVEGRLKVVLHTKISWDALVPFATHSNDATELLELISNEEYFELFKNIVEEPEEDVNALWLSNIERLISDCFSENGPEATIESSNLGYFQEALHKRMNSGKSILGLLQWRLFSKDRFLVARVLISNNFKNDKIGLELLEKKLDKRLNLEHNLSKLKTKAWLVSIPKTYSLVDFRHWFQMHQRVIRAKNIYNSIRSIKTYLNPKYVSFNEFVNRVRILFAEADFISVRKAFWSHYFTENQIQLFTDFSIAKNAQDILKQDFNSLVEFDQQNESLSQIENNVIKKLVESTKSWSFQLNKELLLNSLGLSWIDHIETKYPNLKCVSSGKIELLENELREVILEKLKIVNQILLLRARENVTEDLEFNRLNNRITYRDLLHQVTKKKKVWPLRKLLVEHSTELFRLLPCWLSSPETVSAIFPMKEIFDLVIFDEASQCFVERGIPSMYRGKQVVIAGDSQQLKPSDLYYARWQDEETENPDSEVDSLLDLSKRYLLQFHLKSHYRSQSLALMEFSNQNFYNGSLNLLPDRIAANDPHPSIEFKLVKGTWEDQTNEVEAHHVVKLMITFIEQHPNLTLGVITFNAAQQNLILDIFEIQLKEQKINPPVSIFIKNIENVQGDECDIVIFSIGYAPNKDGKVAAHFGSLNQQGGENRLNVAITRAKRKIIIVSSIMPDQLHVEETINAGPKLLKAYLHYAFQVSMGSILSYGNIEFSKDFSLKGIISNWCNTHYPFSISKRQIPNAELTIERDNVLEGLLFTDDEPYKNSLSAKESHALLPAIVDRKNWRFNRLYSRNFWLDEQKFFNEAAKFITNP